MGLEPEAFRGVVADSVLNLVGRTPVVRLNRIVTPEMATVWGKLERQNPGGCVKERIGLAMIEAAERDGRLKPGGLIVEATSGNTGIGLAMVSAYKGYRLILVMPDTQSIERRKLFAAYGAELVLTPGEGRITASIAKAREIVEENPGAFMPNQFENPANPGAHYLTTGPEILAQVPGVDAVVAGVGTGGTITGIGRRMREDAPHVRIFAVEPARSPVLSGGQPGIHGIQGIGSGFRAPVLDMTVVTEVIRVADEDAMAMARRLAREEGLLVGISSGAATVGALDVALRLGREKIVVVVLPDTGERYLSTPVFDA
ncbi:MAG: cysteine synthase A [Anaerolineae bacterium]|jgi:cysteine synthase A|nr:cysteine synthase A [Anaerolineae bacterium]